MNVIINGQQYQLARGATVAHAVAEITTATHGVAVAVNDQVVSRTAWDATPVADGDRIEVLFAVQGG